MAKKFFNYRLEGIAKRPVIAIKLLNMRDEASNWDGLLDSGADNIVIPSNIAKAAGIAISGEEQQSTGACGKNCLSYYAATAFIEILDKKIPCIVHILHEKHGGNDEKEDRILLGRQGIFDSHRITFNKEGVEIESTD
ncbi:MAG: hypothetical protein ABIG96_05015 [Candidatus Micrarchaeota archaeon]